MNKSGVPATDLAEVIAKARQILAGTGLASLPDDDLVAFVQELTDEGDREGSVGKRGGGVIGRIAESRGRDLYLDLLRRGPAAVQAYRQEMAAFEARLQTWPWQSALEGLDMMRIAATESADAHYRRHRLDVDREDDHRWEALLRLHRRAFMIAAEAAALLRTGFPTGAHARWRSLHEVSLVAFLLMGGDEDLAERYLRHQAIQSADGLRLILDQGARYPDEVPSRRTQGEVRAEAQRLTDRYGKTYANRYGWASKHLDKRDPSLKDIATRVSMGHWTPYVRMADYAVHALSKSMHWDLGEPEPDLPRVGATNYGLEDAGQATGYALGAATVPFLLCRVDLDSLVASRTLHLMSNEVARRFVTAGREQRRSMGSSPRERLAGSRRIRQDEVGPRKWRLPARWRNLDAR